MPLAASVKSRMLRFLRRSTRTRGPQGVSSARSSKKKGGGDTSTVIPNTRFSVLVDSPSATRRMVTIAEPYTMALGTAGVAVTASSSGSKHAATTKRHTSNKESYLSASRARRHKAQVLIMISVGTGPKLSGVFECIGQGFPSVFQSTCPIVLIGKVSDVSGIVAQPPRAFFTGELFSSQATCCSCFYKHGAIGLQTCFFCVLEYCDPWFETRSHSRRGGR
jgi:hypothetical protein